MEKEHKFYESHSSEISLEVFQKIIERMEGTIDGRHNRQSWDFEETEDSLTFKAEVSYWAYHDETVYEFCEVRLIKENDISDNIEWITDEQRIIRMNIPCKGLYVLDSSSYHNGDWFYDKGEETVFLLLEPYGLKGVWKYYVRKGEYRE